MQCFASMLYLFDVGSVCDMRKPIYAPKSRALRHFVVSKRVKTVHLIFPWLDITLRAGLFTRSSEET